MGARGFEHGANVPHEAACGPDPLASCHRGGTACPQSGIGTRHSIREVAPILAALREDLVPEALRSKTPEQLRESWPRWVRERDGEIRERLDRGERDSIVNLLLFGTTFTKQPRPATPTLAAINQDPSRMGPLLEARLDDFVAALASALRDERLNVARRHLERHGIDVKVPAGLTQAAHLSVGRSENSVRRVPGVLAFNQLGKRAARAAPRADDVPRSGLSSDTSIFVNLALNQALEAIVTSKLLRAGSARRVGIVGPGLDFADKHDGHDFYPQQPFSPSRWPIR